MPFEIWIVSTATPVAFQPERVNGPPIETRHEAKQRLVLYDAADRRSLVIERDELGNVVPTEDEIQIAQQAHDDEADADNDTDELPQILATTSSPTGAADGGGNDGAAAGAGPDGGAAPEWESTAG